MLIKTIQHLMTLTVGFLAGYLLFNKQPPQVAIEPQQIASTETMTTSIPAIELAEKEATITVDKNTLNSTEIEQLKRLVKSQTSQILKLEENIKAQAELIATNQKHADKPQKLKTMSMKEFEEDVKNKFVNRFKGYAIELEKNQLKDIKASFETQQARSSWSAEYENYISDYMSKANPDNLHFIEELNCNKSMCRLKVESNNLEDWEAIYSQMTQQKWYDSLTFIERSNDPNRFTYYIPKRP
ncbi:hypothetical protein [Aliikangiella sp. IMCC44359]|uniref:hypothetical protein n=1 Tax=Aliikangiella sp. IMCC44359 TaxID=3459125 RepID=UPI00403B2973